jgi:hypothetical protein
MEIVNFLAEVHGFKRFLEISTATTGARFGDAGVKLLRDETEALLHHKTPHRFPDAYLAAAK